MECGEFQNETCMLVTIDKLSFHNVSFARKCLNLLGSFAHVSKFLPGARVVSLDQYYASRIPYCPQLPPKTMCSGTPLVASPGQMPAGVGKQQHT